jgi:hypothetical protein
MPPQPPNPGTDPGEDFDLASSFQVLIRSIQSLEGAIASQSGMMRTVYESQRRFSTGGKSGGESAGMAGLISSQYQPRMQESVLRQLSAQGALPADTSGGMHAVSKMNALASMQGLQRYGAQYLGQMIAGAGSPLYEPQNSSQSEQGSRGGSNSGGGTPGAGAPPGSRPAGPTASGTGEPASGWPSSPFNAGAFPTAYNTTGAGRGYGPSPLGPPPAPSGGSGSALPRRGGGIVIPAGGIPVPPIGGASGQGGGSAGGGIPAAGAGGGPRGRRWSMQGIRANVGARVAMTGGTLGGLTGALKKVPVLGTAVDAVQGGVDFYQNQREAGRTYQEAEGGSNIQGQEERYNSLFYQARMFGRLPSGAAAQAFGQVTAMGYNDAANDQGNQLQNRSSALNFAYTNYQQQGTSIQQSMQILQTASQNAEVSLTRVSSAMSTLSKTAGEAGTNAEQARDNFNSLLSASISSGAGSSSPQLAGSIATYQAQLGKSFSGSNFSSLVSPNMQYMMAGAYGMAPSAVQSVMTSNPQQYNQMTASFAKQQISNVLTPQETSGLQQMIAGAGGYAALNTNPNLAQSVFSQFLQKYQASNPNLDTNVLAQQLSQFSGTQLNQNTVGTWITDMYAGVNQADTGAGGSAPGSSVSASKQAPASAPTGKYGLAVPVKPTLGPSFNKTGQPQTPGQSWQQVLQRSSGGSAAAGNYLSQVKSSGQRNPVLESLMQNVSSSDQVSVQTSSGSRVMSFADAMKYYPSELESGNTDFYNSKGQSLGTTSQFTNGLVNTANAAAVTAEEKQKQGTNAGVSITAWDKAHPSTTGSGSGSGTGQAYTLGLTQEASQLVKLMQSQSDTAAATGTPAATTYVASPSR